MNKARLQSRAKLMEPRRPQETTLCMYEFASMKTTHHATEQHNAYHKHISVASTTHRPKKTLQSKSRRKIGRALAVGATRGPSSTCTECAIDAWRHRIRTAESPGQNFFH